MQPFKLSLILLAGLGLLACDVIDKFTVDPGEVQAIIAEVTAEGGEAELLIPGTGSTKVAITDENSPIYGAYIEVPEEALSSKDFDILAVVKPAKGFKNPSAEQVTAGAVADIALLRLSKNEVFKPRVAVKVGVPIGKDVRNENLVVGHLAKADATKLTVLAESAVEELDGTVRLAAGKTGSFSPFVAMIPEGDEPNFASAGLPPCTREGVDANDKVHTIDTFTYDDDLNRIKTETDRGDQDYDADPPKTVTEPDGEIDAIYTAEYDEFGNETSSADDTDADGTIDYWKKRTLYYNASNQVTLAVYTLSAGSLPDHVTYEYDADGNLITQTEYNANGDVVYIEESEYDADGNLVKVSIDDGFVDGGAGDDDADGEPDKFRVYVYEDGLLVERIYQDADGEDTLLDEFFYDENGNQIREIHNSGPVSSGNEIFSNFTYDCWE